jgi:hypothetical protein
VCLLKIENHARVIKIVAFVEDKNLYYCAKLNFGLGIFKLLESTDSMMNSDIFLKATNKGRSVFASRDFSKGETVVVGRRVEILPDRTMHSLQMDFDLHVELDEPGRLLNHSCSPNTGVRNNQFGGYDFVALVDIPSGREITWD